MTQHGEFTPEELLRKVGAWLALAPKQVRPTDALPNLLTRAEWRKIKELLSAPRSDVDRGDAVNLVFDLREYGDNALDKITMHGLRCLFDAIERMDAALKEVPSETVHIDADYYNQMADGLDLLPTQSTENAALVNCAARLIRSLASRNAAPQAPVDTNSGRRDQGRAPEVAPAVAAFSSDKQETPQTDAFVSDLDFGLYTHTAEQLADHARQLERELAEAKRLGNLAADNCDEALERAEEAVRQLDAAQHDLARALANHSADLSARVELLREASDCLRLALDKSGADSELDGAAWERCENCIEAITRYVGEKK